MYETLNRTLIGVSPILMHNGRLANPLDEIGKEMKAVTSKRKKTDRDHELLSDLEWLGSIYTTEDIQIKVRGYDVNIDSKGKLCVPGENVEAMLIVAGTKMRRKDAFAAGILVDGALPLEYSGPKSLSELFSKKGFRHVQACRVQRNRIMRTRAIVRSWSLPLTVQYLPELLNPAEIDAALQRAGETIGLGDYRPKYGRFTVQTN